MNRIMADRSMKVNIFAVVGSMSSSSPIFIGFSVMIAGLAEFLEFAESYC